jgi:signal transduction histidine kinase
MKRMLKIARLLVLVIPLLALIPMVRIGLDWVRFHQFADLPLLEEAPRGFDWVVWKDTDGRITADYVFPNGPAARSGLRTGDPFYMLEYQQFFDLEGLLNALDAVHAGEVRTYSVLQNNAETHLAVEFTRYPTFLYPRSAVLWQFALWGFTVGAFLHLLGLFLAGPLALHSRRARFQFLLILVSSLWMFGNLLRLLLVELFGPPTFGSGYDLLFQSLTLLGLVGWIGFPLLLLYKVVRDSRYFGMVRQGLLTALLALPTTLLAGAVLLTSVFGAVGPITLERLLVPILFYASCYIAVAALLVLMLYRWRPEEARGVLGGWSRTGSALIFVTALLMALSVLDIVPILGRVNDTTAGWLIVSAQLLSIAPVSLVSIGTLQHGRVDEVLTRTFTYLLVLGLIFLLSVGGFSLLNPYLAQLGSSRYILEGLYVVVLLILFERLARRLRVYASTFFTTDRQRARQRLRRFQEQMRSILRHEALAQQTIQAVGEALGARSAILFLRPASSVGPWLTSSYHPEPPYLTEQVFQLIWPFMQHEGRIWSRNPELNESALPADLSRLLHERGVGLAVPVLGDSAPMGLLVLGLKKKRTAVYTLEDLELLRTLSSQLALAVERLDLVEREKMLARQRAEAQLVALRAQINPHFLFNALNTIMALIGERPAEAEAAVEHLSAIFRHVLQTGGEAFVPLEDELRLVTHYLHIEQVRFGPRLQTHLEVDPAVRHHPVPAFALQTLVENAVKHGLEKQREGGTLTIVCRPEAMTGMVEVCVSDTGMGIPALFDQETPSEHAFFGIGLRNVSDRMQQLYGRDDLLHLVSQPGAGTTARLLLPPVPSVAASGDPLSTPTAPPALATPSDA